jgi:hypothetical protein
VPADRLVFVLNLPNVVGGMLLPLVLVLTSCSVTTAV